MEESRSDGVTLYAGAVQRGCTVLAVLVALYAAAQLLLSEPGHLAAAGSAVAVGLVSAAVARAARTGRLATTRATDWAVVGVLLVIVLAVVVQAVIQPSSAEQVTTQLFLAIAGTGAVIHSDRRMAVTLTIVASIWLGATLASDGWAMVLAWLPSLFLAVAVSAVLHSFTRRLYDLAETRHEAEEELSRSDPLTGLPNRTGFLLQAAFLQAVAKRETADVWCAFLDVDGFKEVNDTRGHAEGDQLLVQIAAALRATARESDVVGRWGGDEFVVLGLGSPPPPGELEGRVRRHGAQHADRALPSVTAGIGCATAAQPRSTDDLVTSADEDMYRRRSERRNR